VIGIGLANYSSRKSRQSAGEKDFQYLGEDREWLIIHSKDVLKTEHFDFFIYGHRHVPVKVNIGGNSLYVNLGDWMKNYTYAVFDGANISLEKFD
jgi:UDP-2,3-diacylglucosamine hydrolase